MQPEARKQLDLIFNPRGIALFGGVSKVASFGYLQILSQILYGYEGKIYPISKNGGKLAGNKVYKSLDEVDGPVDLASISVPARAVPGILKQCLDHGLAGAQIHSSGFSETGTQEGTALEEELVRISSQGIRVVGPNCFGIHSSKGGITVLPGFGFSKEPGSVAMISQSGGVATDFGYEAQFMGLGLSKVVSFGNGCDLDAIELLDYLADDDETEYIAAYIEGIRDGQKFLDLLRKVTPEKPVVLWKGGLTPLGGRATLSHTGSMGGEKKIWGGAVAQAGAVSVQGLNEMMDALVAIKYLNNRGRRISLVGGGGAIGVFSSDLASKWGLEIPEFSNATQKKLREYFPAPGNSMVNPLDTGSPALPVETIQAVVREILKREKLDVLIIVMLLRTLEVDRPAFFRMMGIEHPPAGTYLMTLLEKLPALKEETGKDIVMVFDNRSYGLDDLDAERVSRKLRGMFQTKGIPVFSSTKRALRGIWHASKVGRQ
ncbi:CoA-binding protein [Thermodesulfobacteriota bacterium]